VIRRFIKKDRITDYISITNRKLGRKHWIKNTEGHHRQLKNKNKKPRRKNTEERGEGLEPRQPSRGDQCIRRRALFSSGTPSEHPLTHVRFDSFLKLKVYQCLVVKDPTTTFFSICSKSYK
jgi:hypothetical protein